VANDGTITAGVTGTADMSVSVADLHAMARVTVVDH